MNTKFEALLDFSKTYDEDSGIEKHTPSKGMWIVEGYAATSDLDSQGHIIAQDALNMGAECLKKYETVLFNHDYDRPIGKLQHVESMPGKLFVKVGISKTEPKLWGLIQDGTLSKFSISGRITDSEYKNDDLGGQSVRVIKGMELHEVSLVSVPANVQAKSINYYIEKSMRQEEEALESDVLVKVKTKTLLDVIKSSIFDFLKGEKEDLKQEAIVEKGKESELMSEQVKSEEVKKEEAKLEETVVKSDEAKQVTLDVSALKDVIVELQSLAKTVTSQSEVVKGLVESAKKDSDDISKTKDEIAKVFSDLNELIKDIPLRKGQAAEKEEDRKEEVKDFTQLDEYKTLNNPADRLGKILNFGLNSK